MQVLVLHLQAPLMSFGGPQVDQIGPTGRFPTLSQITGLLANALGYSHDATDRLQALQDRLSVASALVHAGDELLDYQTVDLGQPHLRNPAWTTRRGAEHRLGGAEAKYGTHIRLRRYRVDANVISVVSLTPPDDAPTLSTVGAALIAPARPLVIGRNPCLPSTRLFVGIIEGVTELGDGLARVPTAFPEQWENIARGLDARELPAEWPVGDRAALLAEKGTSSHRVIDQRDWHNQLHGGERIVARGLLTLGSAPAADRGGTP